MTDQSAGTRATIPASLSPAEAREVHRTLLASLEEAASRGVALALDTDGGPASPCARQLIAATERSAEARGVALDFGPGAEEARLPLTPN